MHQQLTAQSILHRKCGWEMLGHAVIPLPSWVVRERHCVPFSLFLYLSLETLILLVYYYYYLFRKFSCSPILLSLQVDYNPVARCAHRLLVLPSRSQNPELSAHNFTQQGAKVSGLKKTEGAVGGHDHFLDSS
jgi:hypothetical protein